MSRTLLRLPLGPGDVERGSEPSYEAVWAEPEGGNRYSLLHSSAFLPLATGDVLTAESRGGPLVATAFVQPSPWVMSVVRPKSRPCRPGVDAWLHAPGTLFAEASRTDQQVESDRYLYAPGTLFSAGASPSEASTQRHSTGTLITAPRAARPDARGSLHGGTVPEPWWSLGLASCDYAGGATLALWQPYVTAEAVRRIMCAAVDGHEGWAAPEIWTPADRARLATDTIGAAPDAVVVHLSMYRRRNRRTSSAYDVAL